MILLLKFCILCEVQVKLLSTLFSYVCVSCIFHWLNDRTRDNIGVLITVNSQSSRVLRNTWSKVWAQDWSKGIIGLLAKFYKIFRFKLRARTQIASMVTAAFVTCAGNLLLGDYDQNGGPRLRGWVILSLTRSIGGSKLVGTPLGKRKIRIGFKLQGCTVFILLDF